VTIGENDFAQLWQLPDGTPSHRFRHKPFVSSAAFSPDGKLLVTAGWDGMAYLWDVATGNRLTGLQHQGRIIDAKFSPNGRIVVTAGFEDGFAGVWEVPSGGELFRLRQEGGVRSISFDSGHTLQPAGRMGRYAFGICKTAASFGAFNSVGT